MNKSAGLAGLSLLLLVSAPAMAQNRGEGVLVGKVTNTVSQTQRRMFVTAGGQKWAVHMGNTNEIYHAGSRVSAHDIDIPSWVRVDGKRIGDLRFEARRVQVIGDRAAYRRSKSFRPSSPDGYYLGPGDSRERSYNRRDTDDDRRGRSRRDSKDNRGRSNRKDSDDDRNDGQRRNPNGKVIPNR